VHLKQSLGRKSTLLLCSNSLSSVLFSSLFILFSRGRKPDRLASTSSAECNLETELRNRILLHSRYVHAVSRSHSVPSPSLSRPAVGVCDMLYDLQRHFSPSASPLTTLSLIFPHNQPCTVSRASMCACGTYPLSPAF